MTLKTEYAIVGGSKSCAITSSLHLNAKENIKNLAIRLPIVPSWREAIRADRAFTSITCEFFPSYFQFKEIFPQNLGFFGLVLQSFYKLVA